ncbi:MAG: diadenylate cyclase CdaA [Deltaproteobacteria bacterium]|jgi:diadenylate cyclase|nr:diadenylate cyclase CdaA [Deltaproteobacteria bacterium]
MNGFDLSLFDYTYFSMFTFALDILLLTYIVYKFLVLVKGTRAFLMLIGLIIFISLSSLFSYYLNLFTIQWLLSNVFNYFFLFIIIIFQKEIRRVLIRIGKGLPLFTPIEKEKEIFEDIIKAIDDMAQIHIGALLVFVRQTKVDDQLLTMGQLIDAEISKDLLMTLFNESSNNPLHDGAVIFENSRISRASVLLPLSEQKDLPSKYGTRHRAALGISENSDAVAVVISEERGIISICEQGNIVEMENISRLRNELMRLMRKQSITPSTWWSKNKKGKSSEL